MTQSPARILIVDNDPLVRQQLTELFRRLGYQSLAPEGAGETLIALALNAARVFRPHVAIIDLRLGDDEADHGEGLELLSMLKPARPILYTAYENSPVRRDAARMHGVVSVVNKAESPGVLFEEVEQAARQACACRRGLRIERPPACSAERVLQTLRLDLDGDGLPDLPDDLLALLFPHETQLRLEPLVDTYDDAQPVPHGRTMVMRVWQGDRLQPQMVKFAPSHKIEREQERYHTHVKHNLGGNSNAELAGCEVFYDLGVALYSFLSYHDHKPLKTLAETCAPGSEAQVAALLRYFFVDVWGDLYRQRRPLKGSLYEAYNGFLNLQKRIDKAAHLPDWIDLPGLAAPLRNPFRWLAANHPRSLLPGLQEARTHGDLHAGNLLTDGEHTWVIDFERTGWGPLLRDFVELEVDLATRLIQPTSDQPCYAQALARCLCAPFGAQTAPACLPDGDLALIHTLRRLAAEVAGEFSPLEYLWGLLFEAVLVADLSPRGSTPWTRAMLLAATAVEVLEQR